MPIFSFKKVVYALFIISFFFSSETIKLILIVVGYIIVAYEMYIEAFNDFKEGEIFNEELLMILATLGAFYIHSYEEALMVILLFQLGEYLENLAVNKSKASITKLMDLRVDTVNIEDKGKVKLEEAKVGDIFIEDRLDIAEEQIKNQMDLLNKLNNNTDKDVYEREVIICDAIEKIQISDYVLKILK